MLNRFWNQPNKAYRNFQIAFTLIVLHFALPAVSYVVAPQVAASQFSRIGEILGGGVYSVPEAESRVWRYLGSANVMTLALMCALMQLNLRRYRPVLLPLTFLKAYNASLFLMDFVIHRYPAFLAVALFDYGISVCFVYFSRRAYAEIQARPDSELVPAPWGGRA